MNKRVKWGIIIVIGAGLIGGGIYSQLPKENEEVAAADKVMTGQRSGKKILNVNAKIIKPQLLKDEIQISGSLLPDEEGNDSLYLPLLRSLCDIDVDFNVSFDNSRSMFYFSYFRLLENSLPWLRLRCIPVPGPTR